MNAQSRICIALLAVLLSGPGAFHILYAQESDTADFGHRRQSFTVLSQINNPQDRHAFLKAYSASKPAQRYALAMAFIDAYPQSWLLAEVYDIAARASINLGAYGRALKEGQFSLRLRPENSTLLVLMANLEARRGLFDEAQSSAREALDYLDQFARPGNVSKHKWKSLKPRLKASAYFALGRAYAARALNTNPANRELLKQAARALNQATAWNAKNLEAFYLRALVELRLGETSRAAADLIWVVRSETPLSTKALIRLRNLYS
ncbi:MAG: hypothetical protein ACRD4O_16825, partial [Bryobacteraceae bacterium]